MLYHDSFSQAASQTVHSTKELWLLTHNILMLRSYHVFTAFLLPPCCAGGEGSEGGVTDSLAGPSSRRQKQYDDEDEWEELVIEQKQQGMAGS